MAPVSAANLAVPLKRFHDELAGLGILASLIGFALGRLVGVAL